MTPSSSTAADDSDPRVCTACPLLCDDVVVTTTAVTRACDTGRAAFVASGGAAETSCRIDSAAASPDAAIDRAAETITAARRVLVTGLADVTLEAITAACDLAEEIGAAVDAGGPETAQIGGPTIARVGEVTAEWEELRDRADLVIFWFCDPSPTHPRFIERFVEPPTAAGTARQTIAIGPDPVLPSSPTHRHVAIPAAAAVDTARLLETMVAGIRRGPSSPADASAAAAADAIADAIAKAGCVGIVTSRGADATGLRPWSVARLVRMIAHATPAFEVPLTGGIRGAGANLAGVAAVCTWRYAAAGAIARADHGGAEFLPGECDATRLIDRHEVDCVVAVGRLPPAVEGAVARRGETVGLVRIAADTASIADRGRPAIHVGCRSLLASRSGTLLRGDGRRIVLGPAATAADDSMIAVLAVLIARVKARRAACGGAA